MFHAAPFIRFVMWGSQGISSDNKSEVSDVFVCQLVIRMKSVIHLEGKGSRDEVSHAPGCVLTIRAIHNVSVRVVKGECGHCCS